MQDNNKTFIATCKNVDEMLFALQCGLGGALGAVKEDGQRGYLAGVAASCEAITRTCCTAARGVAGSDGPYMFFSELANRYRDLAFIIRSADGPPINECVDLLVEEFAETRHKLRSECLMSVYHGWSAHVSFWASFVNMMRLSDLSFNSKPPSQWVLADPSPIDDIPF